jgi:AcrR family transcriptional regulator
MRAPDRVLRAAMEVIVERGLDQVRLAEIARRAKMSTGHVLYYFRTKDRIMVETLLWAESELARRRHQAIAGADVGWDQLAVFVKHYLPKNAADPLWALWVEILARRHANGQRPAVQQTAAGWRGDLDAILRQGRRAGVFANQPPSFSERLIALMDGLAVQILQRTRSRQQAIGLVIEQCRHELRTAKPGLANRRQPR